MRSAILLSAMLGACSFTENFIPAEHATGVSPDGYAAADYEVTVEGQRLGDVSVWTPGARVVDRYGQRPTVLDVVFRVENESDVPIELGPIDIEVHAGDDVFSGKPEIMRGSTQIEPGEEAYVVARLVMRKIDPQDLDSLRVEWSAISGDLVYRQRTRFIEFDTQGYVYPYPNLADDYFYRPPVAVLP